MIYIFTNPGIVRTIESNDFIIVETDKTSTLISRETIAMSSSAVVSQEVIADIMEALNSHD